MTKTASVQEGLDEKKVSAILANIDRLPTLPAVASRLLAISSVEDVDLEEIISLIESDPAMSTTILSMCRTADKGLGGKINTVRHAVIMLGLEAVQVAALSVHVYQQLEDKAQSESYQSDSDAAPAFDRPGFWIHSLTVACCAEAIARANPSLGVSHEQAYLAGLLHDLGKLAIELVLPKAYERVLSMSKNRRCSICLVENTVLGLDHHTAGKRLAEHWNLPAPIRDTIWLHTQPIRSIPEESHRSLVGIVTLAESWASDLHLGWACDYGQPIDLLETAAQLGVHESLFREGAPQIIERVSVRGEAMGLGEHAEQDLLVESLTDANRCLAKLNHELRVQVTKAEYVSRVLQAIDVFHDRTETGAPAHSVLKAMVESASELVGTNRGALVYQYAQSEPWYMMMVDQGKMIEHPKRVQAPESEHEVVRPGMLADASAAQSMELAALDWLREMLTSIKEIGAPMLIGSGHDESIQSDSSPSFLIMMPKLGSGSERVVSHPSFNTLRMIWKHAFCEAIQSEKTKRVGEELAAANHAMAAMRDEMITKESLVQLGMLASGAAHEMNNPLAIIRGRSEQLFERLGSERERESARAIAAASDTLSDLITSLHLIADPPKPIFAMVDPMLAVSQAVEIARDRCHYQGIRARVQVTSSGIIRPMLMDIDLMSQAIAEPIINAVQASPGTIISVSIESADRDGRLKIQITDRGPGFTCRSIKHAFDPFFSELEAGRRSGLGLARARGLIELQKGEIVLGNTPGKGTGAQVTILLEELKSNPQRAA